MSVQEFEYSLMHVGKRIRVIRLSHNKSIEKFAKELNVSKGNLCEIENGKAVPSYKVLYLIRKKYGVNLNWLVNGRGDVIVSGARQGGDDDKFELLAKIKKYRQLMNALENFHKERFEESFDTLFMLFEILKASKK